MSFMLHSVALYDFDESGVCMKKGIPVRKGMYSLREKSGLLRKLSLSWGMPATVPALSKYYRTMSRKLDSLATAKEEVILLSNC